MRVLTLLSIVGHVWDSKRINMLQSQGASVEVAAFNRPHPVNWASARTNRFYESCLFRKPLIVLAGIGDAEVVTRLGIGGILPDTDMASVRALVDQLCPEAIEAWGRALLDVPRSTYTYEGEDQRLVEITHNAAGLPAETAGSRA